jgi:DNA excision repair protein ERCC-5
MNLNKNAMVALAMLLGGDYTEGVKGIGIVNAMELLEAYDVADNLEGGLGDFKKWLDGFDPFVDGRSKIHQSEDENPGVGRKRERFHEQHKSARTRWVAPSNFPSKEVMKAYLEPVVDQSKEEFTWGSTFIRSHVLLLSTNKAKAVDEDNLTKFCDAYMGWDAEETRRLLKPVLDAQKPGLQQRRIDSYMRYEDSIKFGEIQSKRLKTVLRRKSQARSNEAAAGSKSESEI